jgi:MoaA/NifB/PqqE/SkfB family radical SAM enzyme
MTANTPGIRKLVDLLRVYWHYRRSSVRVPYLPVFIGIETSGLCNLRCVMCPHGEAPEDSPKRGHMSLEVYRRVVDEAKSFVQDADLFGGGEPLLNPRIFDMIAYAREAGINTRLHTNATLLDQDRSRALLESGLDFLSFSFEGYSKDAYERIRVNADYESTAENIRRFLAMKSAKGQVKPHTVLQVIEPAPQDRTPEYGAALVGFQREFMALAGLDEFRLIPLHNYGGKVAEVRKARRARYTPCTFLWYSVFVLWDGTIVPCCVDWWGEYGLGRVGDISLQEAWHGEKLARLRALIGAGRNEEVPLCRSCDRLWRPRRFGVPYRSWRTVAQWVRHHVFGY